MSGEDRQEEIAECLHLDSHQNVAKDSQVAIGDIGAGRYFKGVRYFGTLVWSLPKAFSSCRGLLDAELHVITEWAKVILNPKDLAEQVSHHWSNHHDKIIDEVVLEKQKWKAGDFYEAGHHSALIMKQLVGLTPQPAANHSVVKE